MSSGGSVTAAFIDLATFDELERILYGGRLATAYFVKCIKKSNWFSMVPVQLHRNGDGGWASQGTRATISRSGDYMLYAWMRITLGRGVFTTSANGITIRYTRNLAHNIFSEIKVSFNDLTAMKFDNIWLDFWAAHFVPRSKRECYDNMIGNTDDLINPVNAGMTQTTGAKVLPHGAAVGESRILNLPLPLCFTRFNGRGFESGFALPSGAIPYNEMIIEWRTRNFYDLLIADDTSIAGTGSVSYTTNGQNTGSGTITTTTPPTLDVHCWVNYAIVSQEERKLMGRVPRDMVIEQIQESNFGDWNTSQGGASTSYDIRYSHAVKALYFAARNRTIPNEWSNYTTAVPPKTAGVANFTSGSDPISSTTLIYDSTKRLETMGSDYFSWVQPFYHHNSCPEESGHHLYSYALHQTHPDPNGSTNHGKLANVSLQIVPSAAATAAYNSATLAIRFSFHVRVVNDTILRFSGGSVGLPVL